MSEPLITVDRLQTFFDTDEGVVRAVDDVSLVIPKAKTLGLVGESGCGKSVTAMSIIRLISPPGRIAGGRITLCDADRTTDLTALAEPEMRKIRGRTISMIFQEPMTSLNPVFTIGAQIVEAVRLHERLGKAEAWDRAVKMLEKVRTAEPAQRAREYPHQFSGGMRQRAMIAMALACDPKLLIADEPTTALDVTIQAQILDLLRQLQAERQMSMLFITHDLGVIAEMADEVAVMYASKVVERSPIGPLFEGPLHPYTYLLFRSRPRLGRAKESIASQDSDAGRPTLGRPMNRSVRAQPCDTASLSPKKLETIRGMVPSPLRFPAGCKFHPRCPFRQAVCETSEPELREVRPGHWARCHFAGELQLQRD